MDAKELFNDTRNLLPYDYKLVLDGGALIASDTGVVFFHPSALSRPVRFTISRAFNLAAKKEDKSFVANVFPTPFVSPKFYAKSADVREGPGLTVRLAESQEQALELYRKEFEFSNLAEAASDAINSTVREYVKEIQRRELVKKLVELGVEDPEAAARRAIP